MRIFLSCQQALKAHAVPAFAFWEYYFRNALAEAGHEVVECPGVDWAEGLTPLSPGERARWLERTWTRTVEFLRAEHGRKPIGLFLGYLFPNQVEPSAIRAIREVGVPAVNFFCDNVREFTRVPAPFRDFDLHWVPEAEGRSLYVSAGLPFVYLPMPVWVQPGLRTIPPSENESVVFIGSRDVLREDLLGDAVARGLDVQIYGSGWRDAGPAPSRSVARMLLGHAGFVRREGIHGVSMRATYRMRPKRPYGPIEERSHAPLSEEAYFETTRHAQIAIGVNRCPSFRRSFSDPLRYSRLRDIEAPMLGACYLTEMAPGIPDLYEIGKEIETYQDAGELVEKAKRLQEDAARRLELRRNGQRRALADHTIARSVEHISRKLGITT
jgi:hypothetical protein